MVIHLIERSFRGKYCSGNWKDVTSFNTLVSGMVNLEVLEFDRTDIPGVIECCARPDVTDAILAYSFLPELLQGIRKRAPHVRLHVRTHNAEAFQHWQRSEIRFMPSYRNLRSIYGACRLAWRDMLCKQTADSLLGISDWDNAQYWKRLPGKASVHYVPYACPWPEQRPHIHPQSWEKREKAIVCLAGGRDAIGRAIIEGFNDLADALRDAEEFKDWKFRLSPGVLNLGVKDSLSPRVERMTALDEPWDLLCSVRAIAVLTPLGFGCKTTIIDALIAGCHVLVHPVLAKRLPGNVRALCLEFSPENRARVKMLARALLQEPDSRDIDQSIRQQALNGLRCAFDAPI